MSVMRTRSDAGSLDAGMRLMSCRLSSRVVQLLEDETNDGDHLLRQRLAALPTPTRAVSHPTPEPIESCFAAFRTGSTGDLLVLANALTGKMQRRHSYVTDRSQEGLASTPKTATCGPTSLESSPSGHWLNGFWDFSAGVWALHKGGTCQFAPLCISSVDSLGGRLVDVTRAESEQGTLTAPHNVSGQFPEAQTDRQQTDIKTLTESMAGVCASLLESECIQDTLRDDPPAAGSGTES